MTEEELETSYANFLLALSKYHTLLKDKTRSLREEAELAANNGDHGRAGHLSRVSVTYWEHSKAILWLLKSRSGVMLELLGTQEPEEAAPMPLAPDAGDERLQFLEFIKVNHLGVKRDARMRLMERIESMLAAAEEAACAHETA